MKSGRKIFAVLAVVLIPLLMFAQKNRRQDNDRFFRLMSAQSVRLLQIDGKTYRKAEGPARFFHNNTWLICDTALWSVDEQVIYAMGHVSIEQDKTELTSDKLTYYIDKDLAEFRGSLVQLRDKDHNTLRTKNLDYNTKDSVAVFRDGGAMKDKDGQIIESLNGSYDAKAESFSFSEAVNMFTDSVFVNTSFILYETRTSLATYPNYVEAWKSEYMISADSGNYNRDSERFFFQGDVHMMSEKQEAWCDSLYYAKPLNNVEMLGNVQLTDTTRNVTAMAGHIEYVDSLSLVTMSRNPVAILTTEKDNTPDKVYVRSDTLEYWSRMRFQVDSMLVVDAGKRLDVVDVDAVAAIRAKAAEAAAKAAEEARKNDPNYKPDLNMAIKPLSDEDEDDAGRGAGAGAGGRGAGADRGAGAGAGGRDAGAARGVAAGDGAGAGDGDGLDAPLAESSDSLEIAPAEIVPPVDSTKIGFAKAYRNVRVYKSDMQMACDSLMYCDLDSLARLFIDPVIWNDVTHQYNADSLYVVIRGGRMEKADLLSGAFIHINEDDVFFDQIRGTEMMAYFDNDTQLRRFDALGSAVALFYIKEKEKIATVNKKECTILSATLHEGAIDNIVYFEAPKSDVYPVAQMKKEDRFIKGYNWTPERRPSSPDEFVLEPPRESQRDYYSERPRPEFKQTQRFFSRYMDQVYKAIEHSDSIRRANEAFKKKHKSESVNATIPGPDMASSPSATADDVFSGADGVGTGASGAGLGDADGAGEVNGAGVNGTGLGGAGLGDADGAGTGDAGGAGTGAGHETGLNPALGNGAVVADSLSVMSDSTMVADSLAAMTPQEIKAAAKKAKKEAKAAERKAREDALEAKRLERERIRDERWAELDAKDALKQARRDAKKTEKRKKLEAKKMRKYKRLKDKEDALYERYRQRYIKQFLRQQAKSA